MIKYRADIDITYLLLNGSRSCDHGVGSGDTDTGGLSGSSGGVRCPDRDDTTGGCSGGTASGRGHGVDSDVVTDRNDWFFLNDFESNLTYLVVLYLIEHSNQACTRMKIKMPNLTAEEVDQKIAAAVETSSSTRL